jgi:DNA-binding HxlR family transcriptional regulator
MINDKKRLERVHILRTLHNYGPAMTGAEVVERANSDSDREYLDDLPEIHPRAIGARLNSLWRDGMIAPTSEINHDRKRPTQWSITGNGRRYIERIDTQYEAEDLANRLLAAQDKLARDKEVT